MDALDRVAVVLRRFHGTQYRALQEILLLGYNDLMHVTFQRLKE
jgi:hypothetical protein